MKTILPNAERPPASHSIAEAAPLIIEKENFPFFAAWITHPEVAERFFFDQADQRGATFRFHFHISDGQIF